jgi:hypothetical protein
LLRLSAIISQSFTPAHCVPFTPSSGNDKVICEPLQRREPAPHAISPFLKTRSPVSHGGSDQRGECLSVAELLGFAHSKRRDGARIVSIA